MVFESSISNSTRVEMKLYIYIYEKHKQNYIIVKDSDFGMNRVRFMKNIHNNFTIIFNLRT